MSSLTQAQLARFYQLLENLRDALTQDIALADGASAPVALDQTLQGRVSRGDALQQQEMAKAGLARNKVHLSRVLRALKRMDESDYGYCEECGKAIAAARLTIMPDAEFCVSCSERRECPP